MYCRVANVSKPWLATIKLDPIAKATRAVEPLFIPDRRGIAGLFGAFQLLWLAGNRLWARESNL